MSAADTAGDLLVKRLIGLFRSGKGIEAECNARLQGTAVATIAYSNRRLALSNRAVCESIWKRALCLVNWHKRSGGCLIGCLQRRSLRLPEWKVSSAAACWCDLIAGSPCGNSCVIQEYRPSVFLRQLLALIQPITPVSDLRQYWIGKDCGLFVRVRRRILILQALVTRSPTGSVEQAQLSLVRTNSLRRFQFQSSCHEVTLIYKSLL